MQPVVTIIIPISRSDYLKKVFYNLEQLTCDKEKTHILAVVDGNNALLQEVKTHILHSKFREKLYSWYQQGSPTQYGIHRRRKRIANIHEFAKDKIPKGTEYVFGIEDDTLFSADTLQKLIQTTMQKGTVGFISGIQLGRWGTPHLGAWTVDDVYETNEITSADPDSTGVGPVDAAGFYCFLTRAEYYVNHVFKPFDSILGPDVDFGLALRRQGLQNYIDYGIECTHLHKGETITRKNTQAVTVSFHRNGTNWQSGDI